MTPPYPVVREGRALLRASVAVAVVGLALTAIRGHFAPRVALAAYLVAFTYWVGLGLGALALLMAFHAARARWMVAVRRPLEAIAASITVFPILFVPIALGVRALFPWAGSTEGLDEATARLIHHRAPYLNPTFFVVRAAIYFTVWIAFARLFLRWSTRQDTSGAPELTVKAWRLGAGGLPALGLTLTFAAIDWLMSLGVRWYSTIWGVYYFAGSVVGAIALLIVAVSLLARTPALHDAVRPAHWLSLGKLLLAFTCFWAYIAFSQYMLTWIGNTPIRSPAPAAAGSRVALYRRDADRRPLRRAVPAPAPAPEQDRAAAARARRRVDPGDPLPRSLLAGDPAGAAGVDPARLEQPHGVRGRGRRGDRRRPLPPARAARAAGARSLLAESLGYTRTQ